MLAQPRRVATNIGLGAAPAAGYAEIADFSFARMVARFEKSDRLQMRVVFQTIQIVQRSARQIMPLENLDPLGGGFFTQNVRNEAIDFIIALRARRLVRKP